MLDIFDTPAIDAEDSRSAMGEIDTLTDVRDRARQEARDLSETRMCIVYAAIASAAEDSIRSLRKAAKAAEAY
ncbi:hypothetical protein [Salipiger sp. PrR007]|uniref:hypothetical protein n=1 Tax=Salipiger sp. PrR007 TaxID=2706884 RepID=UPI0013B8E438|nr:hypothetical protein [Salipiger sp. PrR007]NDW34621.1 hypothetical protein [Salipiger sp. PrR007]